jgi:hypothetical protein
MTGETRLEIPLPKGVVLDEDRKNEIQRIVGGILMPNKFSVQYQSSAPPSVAITEVGDKLSLPELRQNLAAAVSHKAMQPPKGEL